MISNSSRTIKVVLAQREKEIICFFLIDGSKLICELMHRAHVWILNDGERENQ